MIISGSDTSFAFLCFGFVATLTTIVFIQTIFGFFYSLRSWETAQQNFLDIYEWLVYLPRLIRTAANNPQNVRLGFRALVAHKSFTGRVVLPLVLKKVVRFRVILLVLFVFLLSIVMYQKLTFDPHEILGLTRDADSSQIKKQYRKLSLMFHPDKNKAPDARTKYMQIRKAYKMLADPDAYEEEAASQSGTMDVSVGLPSFLLDAEYRKVAAPLLLSALFLFPLALIWLLLKSNTETAVVVRNIMERLSWLQEQFNFCYVMMGEPEVAQHHGAKPEDVVAAWEVANPGLEVGVAFVTLCNDHILHLAQGLPMSEKWLKANPQMVQTFRQFLELHRNKQEYLLNLVRAAERPKKQQASALMSFNLRISKCLELLQAEPVEEPVEEPASRRGPPLAKRRP
eukprot:RCo008344